MVHSQIMRDDFDAVIVGAGPAGSSAAITLSRAGMRTCVVDRSTFPRQKLCGGLLTLRTGTLLRSVFGIDISDVAVNKSTGVSFFDDGKFLCEESSYSELFFTERSSFDHTLIRSAMESGASVLFGVSVKSINNTDNMLLLSNGQSLTYKFLIGADGVNSFVAKSIFGSSHRKETVGFALEVDVPAHIVPDSRSTPEIHFRSAHWGYAWVFPKNEYYTIGIGGIASENNDMKSSFTEFLRKRIGYVPDIKIKGHHLPFGDYVKVPYRENVLLCGDAAGLVDSITGEGIAFAIESGHRAAESIIGHLKGDISSAGEIYLSKISNIHKHIKYSNFYRIFIFPKLISKLFTILIADAGTLQRGYLDLLSSKIEYNEMPSLLVKQAKKGIIKLIHHISIRNLLTK